MSNTSELLEGFEIVASDSVPSITLDNQRRFYVNTSARRLMNVKPYDRLALHYNVDKREIAIVTGESASAYLTSNYNVDKRYYMSARHFTKQYGYSVNGAPYTFEYVQADSSGSVFIFRLTSAYMAD